MSFCEFIILSLCTWYFIFHCLDYSLGIKRGCNSTSHDSCLVSPNPTSNNVLMSQEEPDLSWGLNQSWILLWRPNYNNSLGHLITRLYNFVPKRRCSALHLKVSIYVSTPFLFDREVKVAVCNLLEVSWSQCNILCRTGSVWVIYWDAK